MPNPIERCILKGRLGGIVATRTMFTAEMAYVQPLDRSGVWSNYIGTMLNNVANYIGNVWGLETIEIQYLDTNHQYVTVEEVPFAFTFGASGDPLPYLNSVVLIAKGLGIRKMGRKFFPGLTETYVNANALVGGAVAAFAAMCVDYISPFTHTDGSVLTPGIVDKNWNFQAFAGGFVSSLLGTTRRRKPGLGI